MMSKKNINRSVATFVAGVTLAATLASCSGSDTKPSTPSATSPAATTTTAAKEPAKEPAKAPSNLSGNITVDGSSTVAPISKAVAEDFAKSNPGVKVPVGTSGTGGGFKKFCSGDTDISNASRPIKKKEAEDCQKAGVEFIELPIAVDGLTVVVNKENTWAKCLTVAELKKMWEPDAEGKITSWDQIRPDFPKETIALFGAGADSGTFDYFTEAINGKSKVIRKDYQPSEDDNIIVKGVQGGKGAIGFFGVSYYEENAKKLNAVEVDGGKGCVSPTAENINSGKYAPLSRPLFIYVSKKAIARPEVKAFIEFYLNKDEKLVKEVGYVPLPGDALTKVKERFTKAAVGSTFMDAPAGVSVAELLAKDLK
ncbi:PstS family phosphate ABC transporter substrate-binding protein [Pseudanabaena yagii GIHE-NHR1]|uniref:Phosphate-binding protein n=1 Tax=Pseudanabaena yagii GIHE-NHR1 TaxID=2722753 RepID=A0ABX1LW33_9CYAN|nr:PstS family phosphate ABC transporter substrate-binding protein [Pseudanabaena yagii]NMF59220.1 PstS family phosphate ABC transporter substrate-binding protein [Pseudanabaena yagii GIHE-NHR1]